MAASFIVGKEIELRELRAEDLPALAAWRNDPEVRLRTREWAPLTPVDQRRWFDDVVSAPTRTRRDFMFGVKEVGKFNLIGCVGLCYWNPRERSAEISFYIGDNEARQKGFGAAAVRLLAAWGFGELGLNRIDATCYAFNEPSLKLMKKIGFVVEGAKRKAVWRMGAWHDEHVLGLLAEDWRTS